MSAFAGQAVPVVAVSGYADPMAETKALVDRAIAVLQNPRVSLADERRELRDIASAHLDSDDMARSTLGYHWKELSPEQRTEFVRLFTAFIEDAYLSKIQDYTGKEVHFVKETFDGPAYAQVYSVVTSQGGQPIGLNFMLKREAGDWKIYDVTVDQISITANYRSQFNRVINNQGFDALMLAMRSKEQALASMLGTTR